MSITTYTLKIKDLCDSLGSIGVNIDDDEMVQICIGDLAPLLPLGFVRGDIRVEHYKVVVVYG